MSIDCSQTASNVETSANVANQPLVNASLEGVSFNGASSKSASFNLNEPKKNIQNVIIHDVVATKPATNRTFVNSDNTNFTLRSLIPKKRRIEIIDQKFFFSKEIETDLTAKDIDFLFKHYNEAVEERDALLLKISTLIIDFDFFKENDKKTRFYTGIATWTLLNN